MCLSFKKLALLDMVRDKYGTTGRFGALQAIEVVENIVYACVAYEVQDII